MLSDCLSCLKAFDTEDYTGLQTLIQECPPSSPNSGPPSSPNSPPSSPNSPPSSNDAPDNCTACVFLDAVNTCNDDPNCICSVVDDASPSQQASCFSCLLPVDPTLASDFQTLTQYCPALLGSSTSGGGLNTSKTPGATTPTSSHTTPAPTASTRLIAVPSTSSPVTQHSGARGFGYTWESTYVQVVMLLAFVGGLIGVLL